MLSVFPSKNGYTVQSIAIWPVFVLLEQFWQHMQQVFWVFNKHLKSISADSRPKYLATLTEEFANLSYLKRQSFLSHLKAAELKNNVIDHIRM